jgi:16S rRNA (guanine527-N7)-methyltransferase
MNQDRIVIGAGSSLDDLLSMAGLPSLAPDRLAKFDEYLALILRWNSRTNLTAVRDPGQILSRHFVESIACAQLLPEGIGSLLDFGSGAGFPGIPIALCRPEIAVTLAESQNKKAAFLQEAIRTLGLNASVFANRAQQVGRQFDCVTVRAVDRMEDAISAASSLVRPDGKLAILTTRQLLPAAQKSADPAFVWMEPLPLPASEQRILALASKPSQIA